ncbi:HalOD1 output domain-containing protein [Halorientalis salina]|uniref:HalOD1 output domain-containing protein n=1 Tax=Halorientalis salina TaxID=2932266 RepID=UPI00145D6FAD|nr:HalOD1 output domain-containing protein [Halorientalis salina]
MEAPQTKAANPEITESLSPIEYNLERDSFQVTFDSTRDSTSLAIVAIVATALDKDPWNLKPLQSVIEVDALNKLTGDSAASLGNCDSISFSYEGLEITVTGEKVIEATPIEDTESTPMLSYQIVCIDCGTPRIGRKQTPDTAVVPYQDSCPECECENFDIKATTGGE